MVGIYIGNTDNDWFDFLAAQPATPEVNFWQPSARNFHAISEGELFAFRLKSPRNKVGGFGVLSTSSSLPIGLAWDSFGAMNGVDTLERMTKFISKYRPDEAISESSFIGCRILVEPVFLPPEKWFDLPASWARSIVAGKRFSTETSEGKDLWNRLTDASSTAGLHDIPGFAEQGSKYGPPTLITPRLGQGAFRVAITESYRRQCALTAGKVLPALEAAHIRPYARGGSHSKSNGILLRKDIHSVFDAGYATIDCDYKFVVSDKVRDVFNNGNEYRRLHGQEISKPDRPEDHPCLASLQWHNENKFLG